MKAQFNGDEIRQLLSLSDYERQQVISFIDACENNTALHTPDQDAPSVLRRMYTREVKRRKASARRKAKGDGAKKPQKSDETDKLRDTIDRQGRCIAQLQQAIERFHCRFRDIASLPPARNKTPQERHRATLFKMKKLFALTEDLFRAGSTIFVGQTMFT